MNSTFSTPEEEIAFLRSQISTKIEKSKGFEGRFNETDHAREVIRDYKETKLEQVIPVASQITEGEKHRLLEWLAPKDTDQQVSMLSQIAAEKGLKNAFSVAENLNDPQVEDDFDRFLVQYLISGHEFKNDLSKDEWKALHMKLFEVILPTALEGQVKQAKEMMALMEQWYASMQALASDASNKEKNYYSLELSVSNNTTVTSFYCAVHVDYAALFEKVVLGVFPTAKVIEQKEDYNIFHNHAITAASYAVPSTHPSLPITTYNEVEGDPMALIISSFIKIAKDKEGLALQILIRPSGDVFARKYGEMLEDLRKGETFKRVVDKQSFVKEAFFQIGEALFSSPKKDDDTAHKEEKKTTFMDENATKFVQEKLSKTILEANIRIVASAESLPRVQKIRDDLEASFAQFTKVHGNSITWKEVEGNKQKALLHRFSYRLWNDDESYPLNVAELASLFHFPMLSKDVANVKEQTYTKSPAPIDLSPNGILLGVNTTRGEATEIHYDREDRVRHMYVIGQTGTGKTVLLKNMIVQDIKNGDGCCFIDPHGSDIEDILANIPPERAGDVIYFDPSYMPRPMGLNMLEYDRTKPETKTFVVNELLGIFDKLFDMKTSGGPGFEQYFRNATLLVMEHPESGNTLLEIARIFSDKDFRDYKLSKCKNPLILQFWQNAEKTSGDQGLQNWTQYVNSKFDVFLSNDIMRPVIAQERSAFNFREIMDTKKILLVNLAKGRLGDKNAELLGLIIVGKFSQAALSRVDQPDVSKRPDFYLYIDEFQNVTTPAIASILSEARKYRLSLNIAHQYISQLTEDIKGAVFGNVGSMAVFRISPEDAQYLESKFAPTFTASDIMKIENRHAYLSLLANGTPRKPFDIDVLPPPKGEIARISQLKELSYLTYGRPADEVNEEIMRKYNM